MNRGWFYVALFIWNVDVCNENWSNAIIQQKHLPASGMHRLRLEDLPAETLGS